ncbi:hypothetical protein JTB14_038167 [Gonioctena quinquepunctata]|nr:hypothetical protein JTB14_038167 [Gonioctena quinquepunctata]
MTRDGEIPTIFNPRGRNRTPSVVVTEEGVANGPFGHADSISSQQESAGEPLSPAPPAVLVGKLKSCSTSFCSNSARKVNNLAILQKQCYFSLGEVIPFGGHLVF